MNNLTKQDHRWPRLSFSLLVGGKKYYHLPPTSNNKDILGAPWRRVVGQSLDEKSSLCPISVKTLSNVCPMTCKVQGLSSCCPQSVEILSKPEVTWQTLDMEIQYLSRLCPLEQFKKMNFLTLDIFWTNIGHGHSRQSPDWLTRPLTARGLPGQSLNKVWTWTNSGQTLYLTFHQSPT